MYIGIGNTQKAVILLEQALVISQNIHDRAEEGNNLCNLGEAYRLQGNITHAIDYYNQALVISRETGNPRNEAADLGDLGIASDAG